VHHPHSEILNGVESALVVETKKYLVLLMPRARLDFFSS
jgi:hypothetical protein